MWLDHDHPLPNLENRAADMGEPHHLNGAPNSHAMYARVWHSCPTASQDIASK
jgi:hypothetical protein